jgi:hypothetical protein
VLYAFIAVIAMAGAEGIKRYRVVPSVATVASVDAKVFVGAIPESDICLGPSTAPKKRAENGQQDNV